MNHPLRVSCVLIAGASLAFLPSTAPAQNVVGDVLGQLIAPAVGPVLERAAGEIVVEGVRRGYENGRLLPGRNRRRPSPQPTPIRRPQPAPITYPPSNPSYSTPPQYVEPAPVPQNATPVAPPENRIVTQPVVSPNLSPIDLAWTHVISKGPSFTENVIRVEGSQIATQLDQAATRMVDQNFSSGDGVEFRNSYRMLTRNRTDDSTRTQLWAAHRDRLGAQADRSGLEAIFNAADSADQIAVLPDGASHQSITDAIDQLRDELTGIRGNVLEGDKLAVLAARTKNIRNMAVLSEIARVLGVERRNDLFSRFEAASAKSDAPDEAIAAMLGVAVGNARDTVADMQLPTGNPAVVLYNPSNNPSPISFLCDDSLQIELGPGELVPFDQPFVVGFQTGAGEVKRYSIKDGLYRWALGDAGWDIRRKTTVDITIDAGSSPVAFHYLLNGQPQVIDRGSVVQHSVDGPPRIDFDTGLGDGKTKSTLVTPGHYVIGANAETGGWDLLRNEPYASVTATTSTIAKDHWRESSITVLRGLTANPSDAKVNALLDSIE